MGLSTRGNISFGCALVAGRNRVPRPAAGKTALRIVFISEVCSNAFSWRNTPWTRRPHRQPQRKFIETIDSFKVNAKTSADHEERCRIRALETGARHCPGQYSLSANPAV